MRTPRPFLTILGGLAVLCLACEGASAQSTAPSSSAPKTQTAAKSAEFPRTPDGHPDFQGIWSNATVTPLERPEKLAGKAFLTKEEAAAFEKQTLEQNDLDRVEGPRGPDDLAHRAYNQAWIDSGTRVVKTMRTSLVIDPPDGRIPAFTSAGKKKFDEAHAYADLHPSDGPEDRTLTDRCIQFGNTGPPLLPDGYNTNYQIVQTQGYVMILSEMPHAVRAIPLDGRPHLPKGVRQWQGDPRGHWEGDTLVVDTTNLEYNDKTRFGFFYDGMSDQNLHITERFTRMDADTIIYRATIDDPTIYSKPWTIEAPLNKRREPMYEYACHEGNYAMTDILAGARAEEAKASPK